MNSLHGLLDVLSMPKTLHDTVLGQYVLDSRKVEKGDVFLAVVGEYVDGHDYIAEAFARGASLVVGTKPLQHAQGAYLCVDDVQDALRQLAIAWRQAYQGRILAVTGTAGKTTVKEMLFHVLRNVWRCARSAGNYNNAWGVPLTLLNTPLDTEVLIVEVGARHPGDIAALAVWLRADYALISTVGVGHTAGMGDLQGVAACKFELIAHTPASSWAIVRSEDCVHYPQPVRSPCLLVGRDVLMTELHLAWRKSSAKVHWDFTDVLGQQHSYSFPLHLVTTGKAMLSNALMVSAVCGMMGVSARTISDALQDYDCFPGRGQSFLSNGIWIIDETYNANPLSMRSALDNMMLSPGPHAAILGDMLDLGAQAAESHRSIVEYMNTLGIKVLLTRGTAMRAAAEMFHGVVYSDVDTNMCQDILQRHHIRGVMVKGSRGMSMHEWVEVLQEKDN